MRPYQLARLSAEDREALPAAAEMKGLDAEIALLRTLIRRAMVSDAEAARLGIESLIRALLAQKELEALAGESVGGRLEELLDRLGAEEEEIPPLPSPPPPGGREVSGPPLPSPPPPGGREYGAEPHGLEAEAAGLALRHQAGEPEAMEQLLGLLKPAIAAVLLNELAFQPPAELWPEDLEAESGRVLDKLARRWRPGVSFLGYFMRMYPSAMARYARQGRRSRGEGTPPLPSPPPRGGREQSPDPSPPPRGGRELELARLPEVEREIFVLRALEGQSMYGIARRVGVPEMAAYKLYERARQRLGGKIGALEGGEWIAMVRLVEALHAAAGRRGRVPGRGWAMGAAGLKRIEYDQLIGRLEAAGAIEGRWGPQEPGRLVERTAAATLRRVMGDG